MCIFAICLSASSISPESSIGGVGQAGFAKRNAKLRKDDLALYSSSTWRETTKKGISVKELREEEEGKNREEPRCGADQKCVCLYEPLPARDVRARGPPQLEYQQEPPQGQPRFQWLPILLYQHVHLTPRQKNCKF